MPQGRFTLADIDTPPSTPPRMGRFTMADIDPPARDGGLLEPGNIDLFARPRVQNPDGTTSTVRSLSFEDNGREILVPTVSDDGRIMSDDEAVDTYYRTGRHLGIFSDPDTATAYASQLHDDYAAGTYDRTPDFRVEVVGELPREASVLDRARDVGISALKGAIAVPEAAVGLADIATGGRVGRFLEESVGFKPDVAKSILDTYYSDPQRRAFEEVAGAEGFVAKAVAALSHPSVVAHSIIESAPSMLAGGGVGRALPIARVAAGAVGEGVVAAGAAAEQTRQATPDRLLTPGQSALAATSGLVTGAIGAFSGKLAQRLGIADVDTMLAGAASNPTARKGLARQVVEGAVTEGFLEEFPQSVQEQVLANVAQGRDVLEGVDDAAVLGTLAGAAMGGGANVASQLSRRQVPLDTPPPPPPVQPTPTPGPPVTAAPVTPPVPPTRAPGTPKPIPGPPPLSAPTAPSPAAAVPPAVVEAPLEPSPVDVPTVAPPAEAAGVSEGPPMGAFRPEEIETPAPLETEPVGQFAATEIEGQPEEQYSYGSTQVNLPDEIASQISALSAAIPDEDLAEDGREAQPHVTVQYGLEEDNVDAIRAALEGEPPITVTFGKTSLFENDDADVVKIDVESEDLRRLRTKIAEAVPAGGDTHPTYLPHATIAYVKPGRGKAYADNAALEGQTATIDRLVVSGKDGAQVEIPLTGPSAASVPTPLAEQVRASVEKGRDLTKPKGLQTKRGKGDLLWQHGHRTVRPDGELDQRWYDYRTEATLAYNTAPANTPPEVIEQFRLEVELANEHIARIQAQAPTPKTVSAKAAGPPMAATEPVSLSTGGLTAAARLALQHAAIIPRVDVDWGKRPRGSGKRSGAQVRGAMADPPTGTKQYKDVEHAPGITPAVWSEIRVLEDEQQELVVGALQAGYSDDDALRIGYGAQPHGQPDPARAARSAAAPSTKGVTQKKAPKTTTPFDRAKDDTRSRSIDESPAVQQGLNRDQAFLMRWLADDLEEISAEAYGRSDVAVREAYERARPGDERFEGPMAFRGSKEAVAGTPTQKMFKALGVTGSRNELAMHIDRYLMGDAKQPSKAAAAAQKIATVLDAAWDGQRFDFDRVSDEVLTTAGLTRKDLRGPVAPPSEQQPRDLLNRFIPELAATDPAQASAQTADPEKLRALVERYNARADFGNVVSRDNAKELWEDYATSPAGRTRFNDVVAEGAGRVANEVYRQRLEAEPGFPGDVVLTGGGPGSGKTTVGGGSVQARDADVVFDSQSTDPVASKARIEQALASGRTATRVFVYRPILEAWAEGVVPRAAKIGRPVSIEGHLAAHRDALDTAIALTEAFADDDRVSLKVFDNREGGPYEVPADESLAFLQAQRAAYNEADARAALHAHTDALHADGSIGEDLYSAFLGRVPGESQPGSARGTEAGGRAREDRPGPSTQPRRDATDSRRRTKAPVTQKADGPPGAEKRAKKPKATTLDAILAEIFPNFPKEQWRFEPGALVMKPEPELGKYAVGIRIELNVDGTATVTSTGPKKDKQIANFVRQRVEVMLKKHPNLRELVAAAAPLAQTDSLDTGEEQTRLPGDVGAVREQEQATPEFEAPFSLTSEVSQAPTAAQRDLLTEMHGPARTDEEMASFRAAARAFQKATEDYRARRISDAEYLKARKTFEQATREDQGPPGAEKRQRGGSSGGTEAAVGDFANLPAKPGTVPVRLGTLLEPAEAAPLVKATQAVELPEIVAFARRLGGVPQVVKRFRNEGVRGTFREGSVRLRADLFKPENLQQLAATLAHEIGHWIDWLPDFTLKRGNLLGRLQSLRSFLKHTFTSASGDIVANKDVKRELQALSDAWRPWDPSKASPSFAAYRRSAKELYADAISVLLNNPGLLEAEAPTFYRIFFEELDRKPDVRRGYFDLQELLSGTRDELIGRRRGGVREMFGFGNTRSMDLERLRQAEKALSRRELWARTRIQHVDKNVPFIDRVRDLEKRGVYIPEDEDPRYFLEERNYIGGRMKAYTETYFQPVYEALLDAGITWDDFGEALFYERIVAGDRSDIANPRGITPDAAQELLDDLRKGFTAEQRRVLDQATTRFREGVKLAAEQAYKAGLYKPELYEEMKKNPAYVTFRVIDYLERDVTSTVHHQIGTLKDVTNPADATILKTLVTLRAIEYQRMKVAAFNFLEHHYPDDIEQAQHSWNGKGMVPVPPRDPKKQVLVTYMEAGRVRGKYVDPHIADSLNNASIGHNWATVGALRWVNSFLRPVYTGMNLGFQSFNFVRDFARFWKNTPDMTIARAMRRYLQAVPLARVRAYGIAKNASASLKQAREDLREAEAQRIFSITYNDMQGGRQVEETQIEDTLAKVGIGQYASGPPRTGANRALHAVLDWIKNTGDFIETLPKAAGIYEFRGKGTISDLTPAQRSFIRRKIGSPDYLQGGTLKPVTNELLLFSNAITQAWRADLEVARDPQTRSGFWFKTAAVNIAPKLALFAALYLVPDDDDDEDRWSTIRSALEGITEYDLTNYLPIPIGVDEAGNTIYVRLPQDDAGRLIGGLTWKVLQALRGDREAMKSAMQLLDYTAGQVPSVTPILQTAADVVSFASGKNVYDPFRSRFLFTDDELKAQDWHTVKKFLGYEFQQLGGSIVWKFYPGEARPREMTTGQQILDAPVVSNIVGRWIRITNYGKTERMRETQAAVQRDEARARLTERDAVSAALQEYRRLAPPSQTRAQQLELARTVVQQLYADAPPKERERQLKDVLKKIRMGAARGKADPIVDSVMSATSTQQRVAILVRAAKDMSADEFTTWLRRAQQEDVISDQVVIAVRQEQQKGTR